MVPLSYWEIFIRSLHCDSLAHNKLIMPEMAGVQDVYVKFGAVDCKGCLIFVLVSVHGVKFQHSFHMNTLSCVYLLLPSGYRVYSNLSSTSWF